PRRGGPPAGRPLLRLVLGVRAAPAARGRPGHAANNGTASKVWELWVSSESILALCVVPSVARPWSIAPVESSYVAWYTARRHAFLTNFQMRSIRFKFGEYPGRYSSVIPNALPSPGTTAHFWYRALSRTTVIGRPTPAAATARSSAHTDSAFKYV